MQKTKTVIFGSAGRLTQQFYLGENLLDIVDTFKYLGIYFKRNRNFATTKKALVNQAKKAMHVLYTRIHTLDLSVDCQFKLFDQTIVPILLYGCEVWGFSNNDIIECVHTDFLRRVMCLKSSTPRFMLYGESGRSPLLLEIKLRAIGFWSRLIDSPDSKLSKMLYNSLLRLSNGGDVTFPWIKFIKDTLYQTGFNFIWTHLETTGYPRYG